MAQISLPHQLVNGTVADASQVMANFNAIVDVVNGNLGSDNLQSISGSDITVPDINGGTATLNNFTSRFQAGEINFGVMPPDTVVERQITFPEPFPGTPLIFCQERSENIETRFITYYNATRTGFTMAAKHIGGSQSGVYATWLAVYIGAM